MREILELKLMYTKKLELYKRTLHLIPRQREILIGKLLGDGHLETQNNGRTFRLKIEHAITQRPYVDWLASEFSGWLRTPPRVWTRTVNGKAYRKYGFQTVSHPAFRFYAQQFYRLGRKVVPSQIHRWLTPLVFTVWYMDDGSVKSLQTNGRILNTQGFMKDDVERLVTTLNQRYTVSAISRKQPEGWQIFIPGGSAEKLNALLIPLLLPLFKYKLPNHKGNTRA